MKAVVATFNQEKALVGAFSVILKTDCETDGSFYSSNPHPSPSPGGPAAHNILMRITSGTFHTIFTAPGHSGTSDGPRVSSVNPANFLSVSGDSIIVINFALNNTTSTSSVSTVSRCNISNIITTFSQIQYAYSPA